MGGGKREQGRVEVVQQAACVVVEQEAYVRITQAACSGGLGEDNASRLLDYNAKSSCNAR